MVLQELKKLSYHHPVLFFDGVCNLCNGFVSFMIIADRKRIFRYAMLQSDVGNLIQTAYPGSTNHLETVVLLDKGQFYFLSDVSLLIANRLGFPWSIFGALYLIPKSLRDSIYLWVSRNRYKWFGKKDHCMLPDPEILSRFIQ